MPATPAGQRRQRITFQRGAATRGSLGAKGPPSWSSVGTAKAKVLFGTGSERQKAGVEAAGQAATFRVLSNAVTRAVLVTDRISFNGLFWDITALSPLITSPAEIEFTAVASRG